MDARLTVLFAPGRGRNTKGRFYVAIEAPNLSGALYGAANPGARGTWKAYASGPLGAKVREKLGKDYDKCHIHMLGKEAQKEIVRLVRNAAGISPDKVARFEDGPDGLTRRVVFDGADAAPPGPAPTRPKRGRKLQHAWF